jgi:hypothetical protein
MKLQFVLAIGVLGSVFTSTACTRPHADADQSAPNHLNYAPAANNVAVLVGAPCALPESGFAGVESWSQTAIQDVKKKKSCTAVDELNIAANFTMMDQTLSTLGIANRKYAFASLLSEHVNVNYIMQQTQAAAEQLSADGTFIWYFAGHSSPTHFGVKSERFRIGQVLDAIQRGSGARLKRLVVLLDTCYAARVIDGNDPIDLADADAIPDEFNSALRTEIAEYFGDSAPELIVAVASQKTAYSYFNAGGSAFTTAVRDVTRRLAGNTTVTINRWLRSINQTTQTYTAQVGLVQIPASAVAPASVGSDTLLGPGHAVTPIDPAIPANIIYRDLQDIFVNHQFNGYMLYPNSGERVRVVRLRPSAGCSLTRIPSAVSIFDAGQVATAFDRAIVAGSSDLIYVGVREIAAEYIRITGMSASGNCTLAVQLGAEG